MTSRELQEPWLWDTGHYEPTGEGLLPYGEEIVRRAAPQAGEHVLDIGTGTGNLALLCARAGARTTGLDLARRLLGIARDRADAERLDVTWLVADAQQVPLLDGDVDAVVSCSAIVLIPDAPRSARELVRVLRPGGRAVIGGWAWESDPFFAGPLMDQVRDVLGDDGLGGVVQEDPGWFAADRVRRLFADLPVDVDIDTMPYRLGGGEGDFSARFAQHPVVAAVRSRLTPAGVTRFEQAMAQTTLEEQTALIVTVRRLG